METKTREHINYMYVCIWIVYVYVCIYVTSISFQHLGIDTYAYFPSISFLSNTAGMIFFFLN